MNDPVIISCALTGAQSPKSKNPAIPITPREIADDAYAVWKAGAAIVHLHMRDKAGAGTMNIARYRETVALIREHRDCDVIINCTSSGGPTNTHKKRLEHFEKISDIEIGSFDAGTLNWACSYVFSNPPDFLEKLGLSFQKHNIIPEIEIFDPGMIGNARHYLKKKVLQPPGWFQLVLGVLGGMDATIENMVFLQRMLPEGALWSATGIGKGHLPILYGAIAHGGHVRVGLEDNLYYRYGEPATNEMLVSRAVRAAREFGREIATPTEARKILGIRPLIIPSG
jgi:uncharacterized protein (DUF849 family)